VGALPVALEPKEIVGSDAGLAKFLRVRGGVAALEHEHRKSFTASDEFPIERPEGKGAGAGGRNLVGLGDAEQLDEEAWKLDDAVVRPEWMMIARTDGEAEARIDYGRRVEVADGVNNVIETARHGMRQSGLLHR